MDTPSPEDTSPAPRVAHVQISFDLPEGTCLRFTVEALPGAEEGPQIITRLEAGSLPQDGPQVRAVISTGRATGEDPLVFSVPVVPAFPRPRRALPEGSLAAFSQGVARRVGENAAALSTLLFGLSLAVYLVVRLVGLASFPIYFFTDEAVQAVLASDLVRDGFRNYDGVFLPTYFQNGNYYNLSVSVYLQVLPVLLFGKSVFVTRLTPVLVSLLAAAAVGLILKRVFQATYAWAGALLLSLAPAWFLHSRTAFETVIFVSFYAAALACYLFYRTQSPRFLYPCLLFAALAFYSYSPGQVVVAATAILLFFSDLPYHWQNRRAVLRGLALLAVLAIPYIRFRLWNHDAPLDHLRNLGSYWMEPGPFAGKAARFFQEYLRGLSPGYWFTPNGVDLPRHLMRGYGHLLWWTFPLTLLGLLMALGNLASPAHRVVLIALLAAPTGSALVGVGITRTLVFVVPATLLAGLGLSKTLDWIAHPAARLQELRARPLVRRIWKTNEQAGNAPPSQILAWSDRWRLPEVGVAAVLFAVLAVANFAMLRDALVNGPTWYHDYGMGGLQYGASQLFPAIQDYLREHPETRMIISPDWANGTDVVARFFLPDGLRYEMGSIAGHMFQKLPLDDQTLFVMIPQEYQDAQASGKFTDIRVEKTLPYPDGQPGFYFVRLRYVDHIDQILAAEREGRRHLVEGEVLIDGQPARIRYSPLDMGDISLPFDGDPHTVARTLEANPFVFDLTFAEPRLLSGVAVNIGSLEARITARLFTDLDAEGESFTIVYQGAVDHPEASLDFGRTISARALRLEVESIHESEPAHVHVWEIKLK